MSERAPETLARSGAIAIAAGRLGLGIGILAFTRPALKGLGFDDADGGAVALARLAGGRDVALGLHGLAARNDHDRLAEATLIAAGVDAVDGLALGAALASGQMGRRGLVNLPLIAAAVLGGGWVAGRLR